MGHIFTHSAKRRKIYFAFYSGEVGRTFLSPGIKCQYGRLQRYDYTIVRVKTERVERYSLEKQIYQIQELYVDIVLKFVRWWHFSAPVTYNPPFVLVLWSEAICAVNKRGQDWYAYSSTKHDTVHHLKRRHLLWKFTSYAGKKFGLNTRKNQECAWVHFSKVINMFWCPLVFLWIRLDPNLGYNVYLKAR